MFCLAVLAVIFQTVGASAPSWASFDMTVPKAMTDFDQYIYAQVAVDFGTPTQVIPLTVDLSSDLLAAFSEDCDLCGGSTFFDQTESSTFQDPRTSWPNATAQFNGSYVNDVVSMGPLSHPKSQFVLIHNMSIEYLPRLTNGDLGLYASASSQNSFLTNLSQKSTLLNPVVGMRFDPVNPKLTLGALDPADYNGEINWVQMETPGPTWDYPNVFKVDGIKGYNGSFLSLGTQLRAGIDSLTRKISIPNTNRYFLDPNMLGPIPTSNVIINSSQIPVLACNPQSGSLPYVPFIVAINGVDYMVDSQDNLLYNSSEGSVGKFCDVALVNSTSLNPEIALGMPFLRSVYLAYRFPTGSCPGFYGFAFPKGLNRTQAQISQTPTATPTLSSQCLSLVKPTSTPTPVAATVPPRGSGKYAVYGGGQQVPLVGVNELNRMVWENVGIGHST